MGENRLTWVDLPQNGTKTILTTTAMWVLELFAPFAEFCPPPFSRGFLTFETRSLNWKVVQTRTLSGYMLIGGSGIPIPMITLSHSRIVLE